MKKFTNNKINWREYRRIIVFIDVANIIYSLRSLDCKMDYKKLYDFFAENADVKNIFFYTSIRRNNKKDLKWVNILRRFGYKTRVRFTKFIRTNDGEVKSKGNLDSHIIVDALDEINSYDTAVLLSGDSDFEVLIDYLQSKDKKAIICSTRKHIAWELRRKADKYISLQYFRESFLNIKKPIPPQGRDGRNFHSDKSRRRNPIPQKREG